MSTGIQNRPDPGSTPDDEPAAHRAPSGPPLTGVRSAGRAAIPEKHLRTDRWWVAPLVTALGLLAFVVYSSWRAFAGADYYSAPYVSPFYSPCLAANCAEMKGGPNAGMLGEWWRLSPALIILIFPLGFRLTCYYYRKAYYRGFWASPSACGVAEPHAKYTGETRFPLVLQNVHRYFFYFAVLVAGILTYDTVLGFRDEDYAWGHMGLGTLILLVNVVLIWAYTLGCHSCRHIIGGRLKHFSRHPVRYRMWGWASWFNGRHMFFAWASLISVALADFYVYLLATGAFEDPRLF